MMTWLPWTILAAPAPTPQDAQSQHGHLEEITLLVSFYFFVITSCSTHRNFDRPLFHCKDTRSLNACQKINVTAQTMRLKNRRRGKKIKSLPYYCLYGNGKEIVFPNSSQKIKHSWQTYIALMHHTDKHPFESNVLPAGCTHTELIEGRRGRRLCKEARWSSICHHQSSFTSSVSNPSPSQGILLPCL